MKLFEECLVDNSEACKELDTALSAFEESLCGIKGPWLARSKLDRAAARVRSASAKFGVEQKKGADDFILKARSTWSAEQCTANPDQLLEMQVALFDECILEEGGGSARFASVEARADAVWSDSSHRQVSSPLRAKCMLAIADTDVQHADRTR